MNASISLHSAKYAFKLPSAAEMAAFDARTISNSVSALDLMGRAAQAMTARITERVNSSQQQEILVICGPGNNGGDGLLVAKLLQQRGLKVVSILLTLKKLTIECQQQLDQSLLSGNQIFGLQGLTPLSGLKIIDQAELAKLITNKPVIVDAIFGTGQKGNLPAPVVEILSLVSKSTSKLKIALDVPTGINPSSGIACAQAFKADLTLTVQNIKRGMLQYPARQYCGEIQALDIGIDSSGPAEFELLTSSNISCLSPREMDSHKGHFGKVLVIGGSKTMPGAPLLTASAALRAGAGIVRLASCANCNILQPEIMLVDLPTSNELTANHFDKLEPAIKQATVLAIGPGMGSSKETGNLLKLLLNSAVQQNIPCILDADALNLWAEAGFTNKMPNFIATPHPGEMARLLNCSVAEIQCDRYAAAKKAFEKWAGVWVLKGASSIIYSKLARYVNPLGNPYMATAGSGDVLTGIIAALVAQGLSLAEAAALGSYIHAAAGDLAVKAKHYIIASDIIDFVPEALGRLNANHEISN